MIFLMYSNVMTSGFWVFICALFVGSSCSSSLPGQSPVARLVGGPCEGCEAVLEYEGELLMPIDTLPDFELVGEKLKVTGTIYQSDGVTPAAGVILYVYHTNTHGIYEVREGAEGWARRHGYIRGWIRTGVEGTYAFYTLRPGTYPSRTGAAHMHPILLEPNGRYYYLEDYYFAGDSLLTHREISPRQPRGGFSGVMHLRREGDLWVGQRDIILGRNVPDDRR